MSRLQREARSAFEHPVVRLERDAEADGRGGDPAIGVVLPLGQGVRVDDHRTAAGPECSRVERGEEGFAFLGGEIVDRHVLARRQRTGAAQQLLYR